MAFILAQVAGRKSDEDDLEYHVTFPSPTPRTTTSVSSRENDDFVYIGWENDKEPVVMLLGWAGCRDKDLAKYSALYDAKGCITISYVPSPLDLFFQRSKLQRTALKLLELLTDLSLEEHPVIFHMFSNGGCMVYRYMTNFIANDASCCLQIRGCIFDSGPAITTVVGTTTAISLSVRGHRLYRMFFTVFTFLYLSIFNVVEYVASLLWKQQREAFCIAMWQELSVDHLRCPQLFLFSKEDKICRYESIEKFIVVRQRLGVSTRSVCWNDTLHVRHYMQYPEVYTQQIHTFVDSCLQSNSQEQKAETEKQIPEK